MKLSVIMACHNRASTFLPQALESYRAQDHKDKELIILDGGNDNAEDVAEFIVPEARYVRRPYFAPPVCPVSAAWNYGLGMMTGDAWVLLDDDNMLWPETSLSARAKYLQDHPKVDAVYGSGDNMDEMGRVVEHFNAMDNMPDLKKLWVNEYIHFTGFMWRRCVKDIMGGYDTSLMYCGDYDYKLRTLMRCRVKAVPYNCFKYRMHLNREMTYLATHPEIYRSEMKQIRDKLGMEYGRIINGDKT